jgi:glycosyltransferase involved in cell wall biosynthesis
VAIRDVARTARLGVRRARRATVARARTEVDLLRSREGRADLALFHELAPAPAGGGHQFLRALVGELEVRGLAVETNRISGGTPACLYNSFNFDASRLRRFARPDVRMVHRVDGPVVAYRGFDDGTDALVGRLNELADATIVQSAYSLAKHRELGIALRNPVVVHNAPDPSVFHPPAAREPLDGRPLRLVAASWSENRHKGADALEHLDRILDHDRVAVTFVGNTRATLRRVRVLPPLPSDALADLFRGQDAYLAASRNDPCSNALLEALACGLPAVYLRSGGHPELVGEAGVGFDETDELQAALETLTADLDGFRGRIRVPTLTDVAERYLEVIEA